MNSIQIQIRNHSLLTYAGTSILCLLMLLLATVIMSTNPVAGDQTAEEQRQQRAADEEAKQEITVKMERAVEEKQIKLHKIDAENLMMYVMLLILTVLTVWLFKHRRFKFIHETGVTLIYGLIVGLIFKLAVKAPSNDSIDVTPVNASAVKEGPPTYVRMKIGTGNSDVNGTFSYKIASRFYGGDSVGFENSDLERQMTFSPEIFFNILLPPIIFNAGYSLKRRNFFRNIGSIMMFAFLGTTVSCVVVGYLTYAVAYIAGMPITPQETLFFGALISATDPITVLAVFSDMGVEGDLFALVFGESALNDAVAIVLAETVEHYMPSIDHDTVAFTFPGFLNALGSFSTIFFGSFFLGSGVGLLCALLTKFTRIRDHPLLESSLVLLMSYLSFLMAEAMEMTGIVAVLFCGMTQAHYTFNNLSADSKVRSKQFFEVLNFLSEQFIFTYIGVSLFTSQSHKFYPSFIFGAFVAILIGRALFVYPLAMLLNLRRKPKIPWNHMHMMLFSGLRGAIAFALAIRNTSTEARKVIYTTTSLIVIFTVIFNGGFAQQMIVWLGIRHGAEENSNELEPTSSPPYTPVRTTEDDSTSTQRSQQGANPWDKALLPRKWYQFDARFMKPLFTHSRPNLMETLPNFMKSLARVLTSTEQMTDRGQGYEEDEGDLVDAPTDPNDATPQPNISNSPSGYSINSTSPQSDNSSNSVKKSNKSRGSLSRPTEIRLSSGGDQI